jgi:hypothetical protein
MLSPLLGRSPQNTKRALNRKIRVIGVHPIIENFPFIFAVDEMPLTNANKPES